MIRKVWFFGPKKMRFMPTKSVLQTKNRSGPAKNRFSVALLPRFRKAAQNPSISFKADRRNVRHAEKFYTAGVIRVWIFWQSTGLIIGIREPTPLRQSIL